MTRCDDILCGEIGAPESERWSAPVEGLTPADRETLGELLRHAIVEVRGFDHCPEIAGTDHVGVVLLAGGRRLCVRPKVPDLVLFDWLAYLGECPPPSQWPGPDGPARAGGRFHAVVAALLLAEAEALTRAGLRRDYLATHDSGPVVRGRVRAGALAQGIHRLPSVPQSRRRRSLDTPQNQVVAAALDRLPALLPQTPEFAERLKSLRPEWADVERDLPDLPRALADARHACPPGYQSAVKLASLVLGGSAPSAAASPFAAGGSFLLSLSGLWERALRRLCAGLAPETGWSPVPDADRTRRWHDGAGLAADPVRWMTADVLLQTSAGRRWVLDAKYKRDYGREDRNDRFQASAYAMAFGADRATLVYPTGESASARWRVLLSARVGRGKQVAVDSIELPMAAGPGACREAMLSVVRGARAREYEQLPLFEP